MKYLFIIALLLYNFSVNAKLYEVDYDESTVAFSGIHAGNEFNGAFETWNADIQFDGESLGQSSLRVVFDTASAKTGNAMYDGTLPSKDWFDVKTYPEAVFESVSFKKNDDGYSVMGDLTIKDTTNPISFDFILEGHNPVIMTAEFPINRLDFDIGKGSDPSAEWVNENIIVNLQVVAN